MAALTLRLVKGAPLTNAELDANFSNLNTDVLSRLLASSNLADLTNSGTARINLGLGNVENKSSATIRSEITSSNITTALGFTPYNATNPSGYITSSALTPYLTSATAASTYQPLDADLTAIGALAGTTGFLRKTAANTWTLDTSTYLTGNQSITFTGDATGSGATSVSLTLANSGVTAGTYGNATNIPQVAVDAKGRITSVSNVAVSIPSGSLTFTGDVTGTGSTGASTALTLANSGVTAGTYTKVTVDAKGRVTTGASLASADLPTYTGTLTSSQITAALTFTPLNRAADTMIGLLGLGNTSSPLAYADIRGNKAPTSGTTLDGFSSAFTASDVTTANATSFTSFIGPGTGVALTNLTHFAAAQRTFSGTATTQTGFEAAASMTGATTNYGFRGRIPSGTDRWNLYIDGTAANYLNGRLALGTPSISVDVLRVGRQIDGGASSNGLLVDGTVQSDVTARASYFRTVSNTQAAAFTLTTLNHYEAAQNASFGAGSTVTTQVGFRVDPTLVGAGTNIAFRGGIPTGTNRWNLFMDGTASNFLGGNLIVNAPLGFGASGSPSYGTVGQALLSQGSGAPPVWGAAGDVTLTGTQTLTNKRVTPRSVEIASASTITPTSDTTDQYEVTALAADAVLASPSGTPTDAQRLLIRIKDNGTPRNLSWTFGVAGSYRAVGAILPTITTANKTVYVGCIYNVADARWDVVGVTTEA